MGCAFCKDQKNGRDKDDQYGSDEKSRLLDHDHNNASATRPINEDGSHSAVSSITKTDEQSLLSRILHKTAQNIIDVSAIEPHSMERNEYMEKMRHYLDKTSTRNDFQLPKQKLMCVTDNPSSVLNEEDVSQEDINMLIEQSKALSTALSQINIICKEPLVASIGVDKNLIAPVVT